jgi:hypothetical protein
MGFYPFDFAEPQGKQVSCPACGMNNFFCFEGIQRVYLPLMHGDVINLNPVLQ